MVKNKNYHQQIERKDVGGIWERVKRSEAKQEQEKGKRANV